MTADIQNISIHPADNHSELPLAYTDGGIKQGSRVTHKTIRFSFATADTLEIVSYARMALEEMYKEGYEYKKAGVVLTNIIDESKYMRDLFDPMDREKQKRISTAIDNINIKNGVGSIQRAIQGLNKVAWNLRREYLSKCPSTNMGIL